MKDRAARPGRGCKTQARTVGVEHERARLAHRTRFFSARRGTHMALVEPRHIDAGVEASLVFTPQSLFRVRHGRS